MKTFSSVLILTALLLAPQWCASWSGAVVGVTDGDTITVMHHGRAERVRLYGIDCPEKGQDFGTRAKEFTSDMVFRKTVEVLPVGETSYGRPVVWVTVNGKSLNKELVRVGLAWWYRHFAPNEFELAQLETTARKNEAGLWSQPNPVPPWEFRRIMNK
ncbi:MAG TPA: thermonuclease family protein [Desulfomonilaceae bacterium]|nr:thermonuclease family protein [Desulfomonilaceae bacterium]